MKLVIDFETIVRPITDEAIAEERARLTKKYTKTETIDEHLKDYCENKWPFEPDGAQMICAGVLDTDSGDSWSYASNNPDEVCAHFLGHALSYSKPGHPLKFIGFNLKGFDLPILTVQAAKIGRGLIKRLGRYDIIDLMKEPWGYERGMRSLAYYARVFGIEGKSGHGSEVAAMWAEDLADGGRRVRDYCEQDLEVTFKLYEKLCLIYDL